MLLFYLLVKLVMGTRLSNGWRCCMLKCATVYYLIPLPFLKLVYERWLATWFVKDSEMVYTWMKSAAIVKVNDKWMISSVLQGKMLFVSIWLGVAFLVFVLLGIRYMKNKHRLLGYKERWTDKTNDELLAVLKQKYGIHRTVSCYGCSMEQEAFTMGAFRPIILCAENERKGLSEYIISHELVHIKHGDVLWRMLMSLVKIIHWCNPAVWWLGRELEQVCEMFCDDVVLQGKDAKERRAYANLLCEESVLVKQTGIWKVAMGGNAKKIKERMENVMRREKGTKRWGNWLVGCMVAVLVVVNSLTVFAYEDVYYQELEGDPAVVEQEAEDLLNSDILFVPKGMKQQSIYFDTILYDYQFVDEEGNIYPIEENVSAMTDCEHTYVDGTTQKHTVYGSGRCTIDYYEAQRCTKCGHVVRGDYITTASFSVCIH